MERLLEIFSVWHMIRLSGFIGLFFVTFSIVFGMMSNISWLKSKKSLSHWIHLSSAWSAVLSIIFHLVLLFFDTYEPFTLAELFIPFTANYAPFAAGLGTLAFYILMVVNLSSDFGMKKLKRETWKKIHWSSLLAWLFAVIHGVMIGTDTPMLWAISYYLVCFFGVIFLFLLRITQKKVVKAVR